MTTASASPAAAEAAYYQGVEEFFVARRGDPLMLSNADWLLIRSWRKAGIPLRVVLRGIDDALDSHAHSFSRDRKVGSLRYCAAEVEAARDRWERALALGSEGSMDARRLLTSLAENLEAASGLGASGAALAGRLAREMRERSASVSGSASLESWLAEREGDLLGVLRIEAGRDALGRIEKDVDAGLAAYRDRMPARVLAQIRSDAVARRLLESYGLRRLSLVHE